MNDSYNSMPTYQFKVVFIGWGDAGIFYCDTEEEAWNKISLSWSPYEVYNRDGTVAEQFIPF